MSFFTEALMKLLAAEFIKNILLFILPDGAVGRSARYGVNTVILLLTVKTVTELLEGIWTF